MQVGSMNYFMNDEDRFVFAIDSNLMDVKNGLLFVDGYINHEPKRFHYQTFFNILEDDYLNNFRSDNFEPYGEWVSIRKKMVL